MKNPPLPNYLLFIGLVGLIVSVVLAFNDQLAPAWSFTLTLFFLVLTIASFVSLR